MSVVKHLIISSLSAHIEKVTIKDYDKRIDIKVGDGFQQEENPPDWSTLLEERQKIKNDEAFQKLMTKYLGEHDDNTKIIDTIINNIRPKERKINNFFPYRLVSTNNRGDFWTLNAITATFEQLAHNELDNNQLIGCNYICFASAQAIKHQLPFVLNKCIDYGIIPKDKTNTVSKLNSQLISDLQSCKQNAISALTLNYINKISSLIDTVDICQISDIEDDNSEITNSNDNDGEEVIKIFKGVFDKIDAITERAKEKIDIKLTIEITQGFRSSTLLLFLVAKFAVLLYDNVSIEHIYYAKNINETSRGINKYQLIDLQLYDYLLDVAFSMDSFVKFGVARDLNIINSTNELEKDIGKILLSIEQFADAIHLSRGINSKENVTEFTSSMVAFQNLWKVLLNYNNSSAKSISDYLVSSLSKLVKDNIEKFNNKNEIYTFGLQVVDWCLERDLIQQAVTALHTLLNEFLMDKTQIYFKDKSFKNRPEFKNKVIKYTNNERRNYFKISKMDYAFYNDWEKDTSNKQQDYNMRYRFRIGSDGKRYTVKLSPDVVALKLVYDVYNPKIEKIVTKLKEEIPNYKFLNNCNNSIKPTLKDLMQNLNNIRNDMNHYGIRKDKLVVRTDSVKQQVDSYYKVIEKLITNY